jgi:hypothetical protein
VLRNRSHSAKLSTIPKKLQTLKPTKLRIPKFLKVASSRSPWPQVSTLRQYSLRSKDIRALQCDETVLAWGKSALRQRCVKNWDSINQQRGIPNGSRGCSGVSMSSINDSALWSTFLSLSKIQKSSTFSLNMSGFSLDIFGSRLTSIFSQDNCLKYISSLIKYIRIAARFHRYRGRSMGNLNLNQHLTQRPLHKS